jgi:hypothetical protein
MLAVLFGLYFDLPFAICSVLFFCFEPVNTVLITLFFRP